MKYWRSAAVALAALTATSVFAAEFNLGASMSSDNFRILDPQHGAFGGTASSSSPSFRLLTTIGDTAIGSSSLTSFALRSGFLYFPFVVAPTLISATGGASQVALVWLSAQAFQGLTVGGYNVCTKPFGDVYTCETVGSGTSFTKTGLTNGISYTFRIQANDALGNIIADSNELGAIPSGGVTPSATPPPLGGGGGYVPATADVLLSGYAYPRAQVYILRDALRVTVITATDAGMFSAEDRNLPVGTYKYSIYAVDTDGRRSSSVAFFAALDSSRPWTLDGVIIPPTLALNQVQLARNDILVAHGQAFPRSRVVADILSEGVQVSTTAALNGGYTLTYPAAKLAKGIHGIRVKTVLSDGSESVFSTVAGFGVGVPFARRVFDIPSCGLLEQPDLNCDGRLDIVDISILMYYWKHSLPPAAQFIDFNGDGVVDIVDFSILAFYWTG